ncbi:MAG: aminotransferase class V-fold PLP-dependent enzyme [Spirochaetota bacterium]
MKNVYFDNAATSWPKPPEMIDAMNRYNETTGGNPGRSGHHLSVEAARIIFETRELAAEIFNIDDPFQLIFTRNATEALNQVIFGMMKKDHHVITSGMEHNSVMRPLRYLEQHGLKITAVPCFQDGGIDPREIEKSICSHTKMIIMTHASNVTGTIMPVKEVGQIAASHGIPFCVDAAQSAGAIPIDVEDMNISLLAFTGHKSLYGPQGTGGLYIQKGLENDLTPRMLGGTGSRSEFEMQPDFMPDMFESGTPNTIGLAGLGAGIRFVLQHKVDAIRSAESKLTGMFLEKIGDIPGVTLYGPLKAELRTPVVSFTIDGFQPSEVSQILDENFSILSRPGLHCAPAAHHSINSIPGGTVRFSFGYFNTTEEVTYAIDAIEKISSNKIKGATT